jgi:hypothetical protein
VLEDAACCTSGQEIDAAEVRDIEEVEKNYKPTL